MDLLPSDTGYFLSWVCKKLKKKITGDTSNTDAYKHL